MNALRSSLVLLGLCSLFSSSLVRADDCSDSLMAESCACQSDVRSVGQRLKSHSKALKKARVSDAPRTKRALSSSARASRR